MANEKKVMLGVKPLRSKVESSSRNEEVKNVMSKVTNIKVKLGMIRVRE